MYGCEQLLKYHSTPDIFVSHYYIYEIIIIVIKCNHRYIKVLLN